MQANELISKEAAEAIKQTHLFLTNEVSAVKVTNKEERSRIAELGNELQKKKTALDKRRVEEKRPYDQKSKAIQAEFKAVIDAIEEKKNLLRSAIRKYDAEQERIAQEKQRALESEAQKEINRLDKLACSREERAKMYREKAKKEEQLICACDDEAEKETHRKLYIKYTAKAEEFEQKLEETKEEASQHIVPEIQPDITKTKHEKKNEKVVVSITDRMAFIKWLADNPAYIGTVEISEPKLRRFRKDIGEEFAPEGVNFKIEKDVAFTGRC
jgi:hypothetical protein